MTPGRQDREDPQTPQDLRELQDAVATTAARFGIVLSEAALNRLVGHAADVLGADPSLHLTAIRDRGEFVARHVGEALQGASLIDPAASGTLLDLGSGNGYPGLALCAARPLLVPLLAEATERKAAFLREVSLRRFPRAEVVCAHVQRPGDLGTSQPLRLLVTRAMGGWEKIVPRLIPCLAPEGEVLLWAGSNAATVLARSAWRSLELTHRAALDGRERSWIWSLKKRQT